MQMMVIYVVQMKKDLFIQYSNHINQMKNLDLFLNQIHENIYEKINQIKYA
jgi:hypothetical protein